MRPRTVLTFGLLGAGLLAGIHLRAQSDAKPLTFEAVSIKPATGRPRGLPNAFFSGGRYVADASSVRAIINFAYSPLPPRQIVGGPDWLSTQQYSIIAKAQGNPSVAVLRPMLRAMLADRFKMRVHKETRNVPSYLLVMARSDGRLGSQLKYTTTDCSDQQDSAAPPDTLPVVSDHCGFRIGTRAMVGNGFEFILGAKGVTMSQLVVQLSGPAGRPVVDHTGLLDLYDVDLTFGSSDATGSSSIFTALQEQLGLKLEPGDALVEFTMIDEIERPTED